MDTKNKVIAKVTSNTSLGQKTAVAMLACGTIMAFTSLLLPPVGEISNGALWYCGQCFLYAGGIFGIGAWAIGKNDEIDSRMKAVDRKLKKLGGGEDE